MQRNRVKLNPQVKADFYELNHEEGCWIVDLIREYSGLSLTEFEKEVVYYHLQS